MYAQQDALVPSPTTSIYQRKKMEISIIPFLESIFTDQENNYYFNDFAYLDYA